MNSSILILENLAEYFIIHPVEELVNSKQKHDFFWGSFERILKTRSVMLVRDGLSEACDFKLFGLSQSKLHKVVRNKGVDLLSKDLHSLVLINSLPLNINLSSQHINVVFLYPKLRYE